MDTNTTRPRNALTRHVPRGRGQRAAQVQKADGFGNRGNVTDGPLGDVVWPGSGVAGQRSCAVQRILATYRS